LRQGDRPPTQFEGPSWFRVSATSNEQAQPTRLTESVDYSTERSDADAAVAWSLPVQGVMVEHRQLVCAYREAFGQFRMWEPLDGLADFGYVGPKHTGLL
jgi:hypothetical protein